MKRALSIQNLLDTNIPTFDFDDEWKDAFGNPQSVGLWFIYSASGHGKTSFVMELLKKMAVYGRVLYESYEEGFSENLKQTAQRLGLNSTRGRVMIAVDSLEELKDRLKRSRGIKCVVIDSLDMSEISNIKQISRLLDENPTKLFVLTGWAIGKTPASKLGQKVLFMANQKIYVEGFRAFSKGRSIGEKGYYTIWDYGASQYWDFK